MSIIGNVTGFLVFIVLVVGVILSLTGRHRSKIIIAGGFGALAFTTMTRQLNVIDIVLGQVMGGAYFGSTLWTIVSLLLSLVEIAGFILLAVGAKSALSATPAPVAGPPVPYGVPAGQPPAQQPPQASAPPPGWGPVCAGCGTPGAPGQSQCARCGGALQ